jgi:hypothetical protein
MAVKNKKIKINGKKKNIGNELLMLFFNYLYKTFNFLAL